MSLNSEMRQHDVLAGSQTYDSKVSFESDMGQHGCHWNQPFNSTVVLKIRHGISRCHWSQTLDSMESIWDNIVSLESDIGQFGVIEVRPGTEWWYENQV